MKTVLITGATSGIGEAIAHILVHKNFKLILTGRRADRLETLKNKLGSITPVHTLCFDVSHRDAVEQAIQSLPDDFKQIHVLINNAGNAYGLGSANDALLDDWDKMIDINVKGLMYMSRAVVPIMVENNSGHIINISSIAGKETYPGGSAYCASKSAVSAFTEGLRKDLYTHNIRVGSVCPGLVETEFSLVRFHGDAERASQVYKGYQPLKAQDVAETVVYMIEAPEHVNIADVLILPSAQASATLVKKNL
jgi:3-hydroxy acid dehydrogenase/malonic semialdehyde reductase